MQVKETRDFFRIQVIVSATSINEENIEIDFGGIDLYSNDEDDLIEIRNRRVVYDIDRCSEGLKIDIFILNEGDDIHSRIDYLMDEDYEIKKIYIHVRHKRTKKEYTVKVNSLIGEQVKKSVPVELSTELEKSVNYICDNITDGNSSIIDTIFDSIRKNEELQTFINTVKDLDF